MEKQLGISPILSLEEIAIRKSVVHLWSEPDILECVKEFTSVWELQQDRRLWEYTVEIKVKAKISKLVVSELLKSRMNVIAKPIGLQIAKWLKFMKIISLEPGENLYIDLLKHLCWTSAGVLNYEKTAEKFVSLQTLDVVKRFQIACKHCLLDSLPLLWKILPEVSKKSCKHVAAKKLLNPSSIWSYSEDDLLYFYWTCVLTGEEYKLLEVHNNFYLDAFKSAAKLDNKPAAVYFFQMLDNEERDSVLHSQFPELVEKFLDKFVVMYFPEEKFTSVLWFLLSQMTPEQEFKVFRDHPYFIFRIFMYWPWHDQFLDKIHLIWNSVSENSKYDVLMHHINMHILSSDCFFPELFQEFFRRSPNDFRKRFSNHLWHGKMILSRFVYREDEETIRVILRNTDDKGRVRLVSSSYVFWELNTLLNREHRDPVSLCVREAFPSKEGRERLKEVYMRYLALNEEDELDKRRWNTFFEFLDEIDASHRQKRNLEDEKVTKRLCTVEKECS